MKILNYFREATSELRRVTWPTRPQAIRITTVVLIFTLVAALILGLLDLSFSAGYNVLLDFTK